MCKNKQKEIQLRAIASVLKLYYRRFCYYTKQFSPSCHKVIGDKASGNFILAASISPHHVSHFQGVLLLQSLQCRCPMLALFSLVCPLFVGMGRCWSGFFWRPLFKTTARSSSWDYWRVIGLSCRLDKSLLVTVTVTGHLLVFRCTEFVPIIWSEVSTPPMYLLYSVTAVDRGKEIFCCGPSGMS